MGGLRVAMALMAAAMLLVLTGCECTPESDGQLCGEDRCSRSLLVDSCGDERTIDCGECAEGDECLDNFCVCEGETEAKLCEDHDIDCGTAQLVDGCGRDRSIDCGGCAANEDCVDNQCFCPAPSQAELCSTAGLDCGTAEVMDPCGDERTIDCGTCPNNEECLDNQCNCVPPTDDALCDENNALCGALTATDHCGQERSIDCGDCTAPDECVDHQCLCQGSSDQALCDDVDGACGSLTVTDECGDDRIVDCGPCADGDATLGAVRDASTGALVAGATVRVYTWPPPEGLSPSWIWPEDHRQSAPDFTTTTASSTAGHFNFEFADHDGICLDGSTGELDPRQWYRFVIDHPDYEQSIFYRRHGHFAAGDCPSVCPISSSARCHRQDFEIWPNGVDSPLVPNLFADPRELGVHEWQCTLLPPDHDHDRLIGLRVRAGAANVGRGHFHLEATATGGGQVVQHIHHSDGSHESVPINSDFEFHEGHRHTHFMDWFALRLIDPRDECIDTDTRPADCILHEGRKISYCLHDLDPFDGDIAAEYGGFSSRFPDPPTCATTEQGTTVGWKDTYNRHLPGQVVIIGPPSAATSFGDSWIEGEVDPNRVITELDRYTNISHHPVDAPGNIEALCSSPSTRLDCSMPRSEYTSTIQERQCRDYLNY